MAKTRKRTPAARPSSAPPVEAAGTDTPTTSTADSDDRIRPGTGEADRPDPDRIARRAYELYQARGGSDGGALEDWLAAEQEFNRPEGPEGRDE